MKSNILRAGIGLALAAGALLGASYASAQTSTTTATSTDTMATTTDPVATSTDSVKVMVMKHICNSDIQNMSDLLGGHSSTSVAGFIHAELACPTTALPGDEPMADTMHSTRRNFDFLLNYQASSTGTSTTLDLEDADYVQMKVCGSDIMAADNTVTSVASTTCLDASHYHWQVNATGTMSVTEEEPPTGYHFGAVLFTPPQLKSNNDSTSLASMSSSTNGTGTLILNPWNDSDKEIVLHVYNFKDTGTSTATTTPPTTGTTTPTTTPPTTGTTTPPSGGDGGLSENTLNAILHLIQRIQDIQNRLVDVLGQLANQRQ